MKSVIYDCGTAAVSLIILISCLFGLPYVLPQGYAYIISIIAFIVAMSSGGYYINEYVNEA